MVFGNKQKVEFEKKTKTILKIMMPGLLNESRGLFCFSFVDNYAVTINNSIYRCLFHFNMPETFWFLCSETRLTSFEDIFYFICDVITNTKHVLRGEEQLAHPLDVAATETNNYKTKINW